MTLKRIVLILASFIFVSLNANAFEFPARIKSVKFETSGISKESALKDTVKIDFKKCFKNHEEFDSYLSYIEKQLENLRLFENIKIEPLTADSENIITNNDVNIIEKPAVNLIELKISFDESQHFIILPKPSYDSNVGAELKIKMKDTNFFGFLNELEFEFNGQLLQDYQTQKDEFSFGFEFTYDFPFNIKNTREEWTNDFSFNWIAEHDEPEFNFSTGLNIFIPIKKNELELSFKQLIVQDEDYQLFGDFRYFAENFEISYPFTLVRFNNLSELTYTPSFELTYNWDSDGINPLNEDLRSPYLEFENTFAIDSVNWNKNFRNGYSAELCLTGGYNFQLNQDYYKAIMKASYFKSFDFFELNTRFIGFYMLNSNEKIGPKLRGILDNQLISGTSNLALKTNSALILNFNMPFSVVTTHWYDWGKKLFGCYDDFSSFWKAVAFIPHKLFKYLDFELQISPFIDLGLLINPANDSVFNFKDGFYSGGIELLIYPSKWKSYVVRISAGFDLGRLLFSDYLDTSWRQTNDKNPPYELFFGLGLHY